MREERPKLRLFAELSEGKPLSLRLPPNTITFRLHPSLPPPLPLYNGERSNDFQQCRLNGSGPILDCIFFFNSEGESRLAEGREHQFGLSAIPVWLWEL